MDAVDVLMEARAYIEKGWCQGAAAKDEFGQSVEWEQRLNGIARSWCALGAITDGAGLRLQSPELRDAEHLLQRVVGDGWIAVWNDSPGRTQEEVLEAFDRAIGLGLERTGERS
jgi:hypothetical protein